MIMMIRKSLCFLTCVTVPVTCVISVYGLRYAFEFVPCYTVLRLHLRALVLRLHLRALVSEFPDGILVDADLSPS